MSFKQCPLQDVRSWPVKRALIVKRLGVLCLKAMVVVALGAANWCAAQDTASAAPAARDTITVQSGYFSGDYANNVDYADVLLEGNRAVERMARWSYEKYPDQLSGPWMRAGLLLGSSAITLLNGSYIAYHEWGHASRAVAMGGRAEFSTCRDTFCQAPRDFFGLTAGLFLKTGAATYSTFPKTQATVNRDSGKAPLAILFGAGVNNEIGVSERSDAQQFFKGSSSAVNTFSVTNNLAIALYGGGKDTGDGDIEAVAQDYRLRGLGSNLQSDDLRKINWLSAISGSVLSGVLARRDFIVDGKTNAQPWLISGFLVPNQYNYLSSRGITRKWVSGFAMSDGLKLLGSYESLVLGDAYSELGLGAYQNFGTWELYAKFTGKDFDTLNLEAAASAYVGKDWKLDIKTYVWDSRSLLGERNTLDFSKNKTLQLSVGLSYVY